LKTLKVAPPAKAGRVFLLLRYSLVVKNEVDVVKKWPHVVKNSIHVVKSEKRSGRIS